MSRLEPFPTSATMHPPNVNENTNGDTKNDIVPKIRYIPLSYSNSESQTSGLRLVLTLFPEWEHEEGEVEFIRFTDGITNTVRPTTLAANSVCVSTAEVLEL